MTRRAHAGRFAASLIAALLAHQSQSAPPSLKEHREAARDRLEASGSAVDPTGLLREIGRFDYPPAFQPTEVVATADYSYVLTQDHYLVTVRALDGEQTDRISIGDGANALVLVGDDETPVLAIARRPDIVVFSLDDPSHPRETASSQYPCGSGLRPLAGGPLQVNTGASCAAVVDVRTGAVYSVFGGDSWYSISGGPASSPLLAVYTGPNRFDLWSLADPSLPSLRTTISTTGFRPLAIDRGGEFFIIGGGPNRIEIFSTADGTRLSKLDTSWNYEAVQLVESGGLQILAVPVYAGLELWDLGDPAAPKRIVTVPFQNVSSLAASRDEPLLFAADLAARTVSAVDPRDGAILGTHVVDGLGPRSLAACTTPGNERALAIRTLKYGAWDSGTPGVVGSIDRVRFDVVATPRFVSRYAPLGLNDVDAVFPFLGALVAAVDLDTGAIFVNDIRNGKTVATGGLVFRPNVGLLGVRAAASGKALAVADQYAYEVLDLRDDSVHTRAFHAPDDYASVLNVALAQDGTAVALIKGRVHVIDPLGNTVSLALAADADTIDISPDGRFALISGDGWQPDRDVVLLDITDRAAPRVAWRRDQQFNGAHFVDGGARILATASSWLNWWVFSTSTLSVATGETAGVGPEIGQFFYHGFALQQGIGPKARAVFWKWDWIGEQTVLLDVSTDTPTVVTEVCPFCSIWGYAPRGDTWSWYEVHPTWSTLNRIFVGDGEGHYGYHDLADLDSSDLALVRPGFLAGLRVRLPRSEVVVYRDVALNHPPVAQSSAPKQVECAGPDGTPVTLDGSASSDSDSAPGTNDDIVEFRWTADGKPAGAASITTAQLDVGQHVIELEVRDALDASSTMAAPTEVRDTLPPNIALSLEPVFSGGFVTQQWTPLANAADVCDGTLDARMRLHLGADVLAASTTFVNGPEFLITVRAGLSIVLSGPDRARAEDLWAAAVARGGLALANRRAVTLVATARGPAGVLARYRLTPEGLLVAAESYGLTADHLVAAAATDAAGHRTEGSMSLRTRLADLCAAAPANALCTQR